MSRTASHRHTHSNGNGSAAPTARPWGDLFGPTMRTAAAAVPRRGFGLDALTALPLSAIAGSLTSGAAGLRRLRTELPVLAMAKTGEVAFRLRELTGHDVIDLESLQDVLSVIYRAAAVREEHRAGTWDVDDFGFERQWAEIFLPLFRVVYRRYWRVDTEGINNIPPGGALLVSNHAGVMPFDASMIKLAVFDLAGERHVRTLIASWMFRQPFVGMFMRRTGQTLGHPDDTRRLLDNGELVLVFPEGVRGTGKPFSERYKLRRFGRGGFVQAALRSGVPIVPISVIGSEETYPMFGDIKPLAKLLGLPYVPITPLGPIPLPSKWQIRFHAPVRTDHMDPAAADDAATVMDLTEQVRGIIQQGLIDDLRHRRTVFAG